jgi:hypothetical protein
MTGSVALAYVRNGECRLVSRKGNIYKRFGPLSVQIVASLNAKSAVLDGEIVCLGADGTNDVSIGSSQDRSRLKGSVGPNLSGKRKTLGMIAPPGCEHHVGSAQRQTNAAMHGCVKLFQS